MSPLTKEGSSGDDHTTSPQKIMLSRALQKANTAVLLDNAQNFEGAMDAYSEAGSLLQQVMRGSTGEDWKTLEAIVCIPMKAITMGKDSLHVIAHDLFKSDP